MSGAESPGQTLARLHATSPPMSPAGIEEAARFWASILPADPELRAAS